MQQIESQEQLLKKLITRSKWLRGLRTDINEKTNFKTLIDSLIDDVDKLSHAYIDSKEECYFGWMMLSVDSKEKEQIYKQLEGQYAITCDLKDYLIDLYNSFEEIHRTINMLFNQKKEQFIIIDKLKLVSKRLIKILSKFGIHAIENMFCIQVSFDVDRQAKYMSLDSLVYHYLTDE